MNRRGARAPAAVAIGASAGGVNAILQLLHALPADLGVPVFVVLHLPRDRPSLLVSIFSDNCRRPVREAQDKQAIEPGTVYVAPPDYHLLIDTGPSLALSVDDAINFSRPSIDVLFESAADTYASQLLGIVLSGANNDGAQGLRAIGENGGMMLVQDPRCAEVPAMPAAALELNPTATAMTLEEIARTLHALGTAHG